MSEDILERAKRVEYPDSALRILPELIAEVEANQIMLRQFQVHEDQTHAAMEKIVGNSDNFVELTRQMKAEVERLRSLNESLMENGNDLRTRCQKAEARIKELEAEKERIESAFLKARQCPTCKGEGTIHPIGQPIDSICPMCLGDPESMAREELEKIKAGGKDDDEQIVALKEKLVEERTAYLAACAEDEWNLNEMAETDVREYRKNARQQLAQEMPEVDWK